LSLDSKLVETQQTQIHYKQSAQFITLLNFLERGQMTSAAFTRTAARTMRSGIRTTKIHIHRWHRAASGATLYMVTNYFHELIERRRREKERERLQLCRPSLKVNVNLTHSQPAWLRGAQSLATVQPQQVSPLDSRHYSSL
jgi:hypothetical protein